MMQLGHVAAFDAGVRREEMMLIQLKHINFKPVSVNVEGEQKKLLVVEVQSKGEKTTGEKEFVYIGTERLKDALQKRRFALKHDPDAYMFGTEDGRHQKDFRRMWRELFRLAGLKWGRDKGLVWHTCATNSVHALPRTRGIRSWPRSWRVTKISVRRRDTCIPVSRVSLRRPSD